MKTKQTLYCVKLYPGIPRLFIFFPEFVNGRNSTMEEEVSISIKKIMKTFGRNAKWLGSEGFSSTWEVKEDSMLKLIQAIKHYNVVVSSPENPFIIQPELY